MDIHIDKSDLTIDIPSTTDLLIRIATGRAILFAGAGFSTGTKNEFGKEPPTARDLAKEICRLGAFDEDDDLRFAADYYITHKNKSNLVDLLKKMYTLTGISEFNSNICSINWKRFYTTNYDKSIEIASANTGKHVECIDLRHSIDQYYKRENLCIHLNGSIDCLSETTVETEFKLSTSSYISPDSFLNSRWHYHFKRDLERSSAIIFVGYSMYDIEIQKILFENSEFKEKTYFITRKHPDKKLKFTLSKFGRIVPIGVEGFANAISNNKALFELDNSDRQLESLVGYDITANNEEIRDSNVESLLMYGNLNQSFIDNALTSGQRVPCLIIRTTLEKAVNFAKSNINTVIVSDFGNGKTIFIGELLPYLSVNSLHVYKVEDSDGDYIADVDALSKLNQHSVVVLDGYDRYLDLI
ncbi:MAG: SIR2 family protein [Methylococcales bacterium]